MPHFFEQRDRWGNGRGLWVLAALVFSLPLALWSVSQITLVNDVERWLSEDNLPHRHLEWYKSHFPSEDSCLISWDDSTLDDPRLERLADRLTGTRDTTGRLRGGVPQIALVRTPGQIVHRMQAQKLSREEAVSRLQGVLLGKGRVWGQFSTHALGQQSRAKRLLKERALADLGLNLQFHEPVRELLDEADLEEFPAEIEQTSAVVDSAEESSAPADAPWTPEPIISHDLEITWAGMHNQPGAVQKFLAWAKELRLPVAGDPAGEAVFEDCFLYAAQPAAIGIAFSAAGQADREGTLQTIRQLAAECGISADSLHLGGSPVATSALNTEVKRSLWNAAAPWYVPHERSVILTSWLAGVVLAFWLLRNVRLALIVLAGSYYVTLVTVALVPLTGGSLNMVLVAMPTLILVVSMSGAVHLIHYWLNETQREPSTAIVQALKVAAFPCFLASLTTAIGLCSLMTSRLGPVRAFGMYSAIGTLLSLGIVMYAIPAMLQAWAPTNCEVSPQSRQSWNRYGRWVLRHSTAISAVWLLATVSLGWGLWHFRTETKVIKYFPQASHVVRDYGMLEDQIAGIIPIETVIRFGRQAQDDLNFSQRMEVVRQIEDKLRRVQDVTGSISLADFQPVAETPAETASLREKLAFNTRARAVEQRVKNSAAQGTLMNIARESSEFQTQGDELWRITSQVATLRSGDFRTLTRELDLACRSVLKYHPDTSHVVTGMVPLFLATQQEIVDSLINSSAMSFGLIALVMIWISRNIFAGLLAMIPNVTPVAIVFGTISWSGMAVDIGTLITASVALGIAVDGTLHMITWYRSALLAGKNHRVAVVRALEHCGPAMWQTSLALGLAMLVLAPASLLLLSRFGWLMCSMILLAMLADLMLTPALLAGVLGRLIAGSARAERRRRLTLVSEPDLDSDLEESAPAVMINERHDNVPPPHLLSTPAVNSGDDSAVTHRITPGPKGSPRRRR